MSIVRYIDETDDRLEISNVYEQSWKSAYKGMIPQDYLDSIPSGRWAEKVDNPDWHTLVCVEDEKIVGTSSFCESRFDTFPGYGEVISIYLLPEYVGRGYGRQLMEKALAELKQMGYKKVMLWVLEENTNARDFYERMGFQLASEVRDDSIGGKSIREVSYEKDM